MTIRNSEKLADTIAAIQGALGFFLLVTPWLFGFSTAGTAAWMAWLTGSAVVLLGTLNVAEDTVWPAWATLIAGIWSVVAPWAAGFAAIGAATWSHVIVGLAVIVASLARLYGGQDWNPRVTA